MNITIIGSGNVGGAFGAAMALHGHNVLFYDILPRELPLSGKLTNSFREAFDHAETMVICVPTELNADGKCDLSIFESVCRQFGAYVRNTNHKRILIQKSTCLPGTALSIIKQLQEEFGINNGNEYEYVVNPSFLNMGTKLEDEMRQRKCLIGLMEPNSKETWVYKQVHELYHWIKPIIGSYTTVELAKYANNIMHAGILSIWNELFLLGEKLGVDTDWVAKVTTLEPGLESVYRVHGMAWGGKCLPKDTQAFLAYSHDIGANLTLLNAIIEVNDIMAHKYGIRTQNWSELHQDAESVKV